MTKVPAILVVTAKMKVLLKRLIFFVLAVAADQMKFQQYFHRRLDLSSPMIV